MTKTIALISALALAAGLGAAGAQAAPTHKTSGELASKAQLAREHARAMKAGDTANDPTNSASSDSLNQQQLAKAQALPGADVQPGAINGSANTSGVDANTSGADVNNSMPNNNMPNNNMTTPTSPTAPSAPTPNAVPPQAPTDGLTPGTQMTPQTPSSTPQGNTGSGSTTPQ